MSWFQALRRSSQPGFKVGVEIEVENASIGASRTNQINGLGWNVTSDGSLRNGLEIMSAQAMTQEEFEQSIPDVCHVLQRGGAEVNSRCSVHVHVNVSDLTADQFKSFMYMAVLVEPLLMRYCSSDRNDNTYCVPTYKSRNLVQDRNAVIQAVETLENTTSRTDEAFSAERLIARSPKYAAISTYRLRDLGTVEFRMFDGSTDPERITQYVRLLSNLYESSVNTSLEELVDRKVQQGVLSLLCPYLTDNLTQDVSLYEAETITEKGAQMANDTINARMTEEQILEVHKSLFPEDEVYQEQDTLDMDRRDAIAAYARGEVTAEALSTVQTNQMGANEYVLIRSVLGASNAEQAWQKFESFNEYLSTVEIGV